MVWFLLIPLVWSQSLFCPQAKTATTAQNWGQQAEKILLETAQLAPVANQADRVLAQIQKTPSIQLADWLQQKGIEGSSPEILAQQWRAYYLKNYLLKRDAQLNDNVRPIILDLVHRFQREILKSTQQSLADQLERAKLLSLNYLKQLNLDPELLQNLKAQINKMTLKSDLSESWRKEPHHFFSSYFSDSVDQGQIGAGYLLGKETNKSVLLWSFLRLIGTRISPCTYPAIGQHDNPFVKVQACLQTQLGEQTNLCADTHSVYFSDWWAAEVFSDKNEWLQLTALKCLEVEEGSTQHLRLKLLAPYLEVKPNVQAPQQLSPCRLK